jgi:hypothetical protein
MGRTETVESGRAYGMSQTRLITYYGRVGGIQNGLYEPREIYTSGVQGQASLHFPLRNQEQEKRPPVCHLPDAFEH